MIEIGQGVDHRHLGISGQLGDHVLAKGAHHDAVHIAGQDPGRVLERSPRPSWESGADER